MGQYRLTIDHRHSCELASVSAVTLPMIMDAAQDAVLDICHHDPRRPICGLQRHLSKRERIDPRQGAVCALSRSAYVPLTR
jgi:hypothetical protein